MLDIIKKFIFERPNFLDRIPKDKLLHFAIGVACFSFFAMFHFWAAVVITLAVGYGIELFQKKTGSGHYDIMDAVAVWLGMVPVMLPMLLPLGKMLGL